jgi:hypothetical protein
VIDLSNAKAIRDFEFRDMDLELEDIDDDGIVTMWFRYDFLNISQDELKELLRLSEWMISDA